MFSARLDSLRKFQISFFWSIIDLFLTISKIKFNLIRIRHYTHKGYEKPEISYHTIFHPHPKSKVCKKHTIAKLGDTDGDVEGAS